MPAKHVKKINEIAAIMTGVEIESYPVTLAEVETRITAVSDAVSRLGRRGEKTVAASRDHAGLLDVWDFVELKKGVRPTVDKHEDFPVTDPVTMLRLAKDYGLMPPEKADSLRETFLQKASAIAGQELTAKQVADLARLFRNFSPVAHMKAAPK